MRTTIQIPDNLWQKLHAESTARHMKGFSKLIIEALENYFKTTSNKRLKVLKSIRGSLNENEYKSEMGRLEEGRRNWRE